MEHPGLDNYVTEAERKWITHANTEFVKSTVEHLDFREKSEKSGRFPVSSYKITPGTD